MRSPYALAFTLVFALAGVACGPAPERGRAGRGTGPAPRVQLDERPVLVGVVVERIDGPGYVYLCLSVVSDSAARSARAHSRTRWVAVEGVAPELGELVRFRSLARRSKVWEAEIERSFEVLEYGALLEI